MILEVLGCKPIASYPNRVHACGSSLDPFTPPNVFPGHENV